ncbi:MAG: GtrA family protein [Nanoarchaeota archaeon]
MKRLKIAQLIRYTIIGTLATLIDFTILWFLLLINSSQYLIFAAIAFSLATLFHYTINRIFNYKNQHRLFSTGAFYFFAINLTGLILTIISLAILVELANLEPFIARIIISPFVGTLSYILNSKITFQTKIFKN